MNISIETERFTFDYDSSFLTLYGKHKFLAKIGTEIISLVKKVFFGYFTEQISKSLTSTYNREIQKALDKIQYRSYVGATNL